MLSQEPAGDSRNFVQVLLNFGSPPTSVDRTHCIRTRNCKHVYLDLHDANLASGTWYIKITGFGSGLKRFAVEFRINTRVGLLLLLSLSEIEVGMTDASVLLALKRWRNSEEGARKHSNGGQRPTSDCQTGREIDYYVMRPSTY